MLTTSWLKSSLKNFHVSCNIETNSEILYQKGAWKFPCTVPSNIETNLKMFLLKGSMLVDTSLVDIPYAIFDISTCAVSVTKSCTISFYAFCSSVLLRLVVFWNSDTLDAILESAK